MSDTNKSLILMIDDEKNVLTLNEQILTYASSSIVCHKAQTLAEARAKLRSAVQDYDLFILDIMLPDGSGLDFIEEIHAISSAPILVLSAKNTPRDIIRGVARGGDNYITKPYDPEAMAALALAMLRREEKHGRQELVKTISRGALSLDLVAHRAYVGGNDILLKPKEFALLLVLMQEEGATISAERLYEAIWKAPVGKDKRPLQKQVSNLRTRLEQGGSGYTILSVYGEGYRLTRI